MANEMVAKWAGMEYTLPVGGSALPLPTMGKWNASQSFNPVAYVASNTKGGKGRRQGVVDWSGGFERFAGFPPVNGAAVPVMPGSIFTFTGYAGPASGVVGTVGPELTGDAIVDSLAVNWDWTSNALLKMVYAMSCVKPLRIVTGGGPVTDTASSAAAPTAGCQILFALVSAPTDFAPICCQKATLNILSENQGFANSCSIGTGLETPPIPAGLAYMTRKPGNIDWNVTLTVDNSNPNTLGFAPGDLILLHMYIDGSTFWLLKWGFVSAFNNYNVDRETGAIITYDILIEQSIDQPGSVADGELWVPGGASAWLG